MKNSHELKNLRSPREKHFLQKDGTVIAHVYSDDIHYLKDGKYEEIDNTLRMHGDFIANVSNAFRASFKETHGKLCRIERDGHTLSMSLKNEKKVSPKYEGKEVIYEDILDGVDIHYTLYPTKVKEDIILKENILNEIVFEVKTNLDLKIQDGVIQALSGTEVIFELETPYMIDSLGNENNDIYYELKDHLLILKLDQDWLKNASFPVIIDPTITNSGQGKNVYDTYIFPGDTNVDRNSMDHLKMGVERVNENDIINRALLKFELPTIGTGSQVISAEAQLIGYPGHIFYEPTIFTIHRVTQDWNEATANWNTMNNKYDSRIECWTNLSHSGYTDNNTIEAKVNTIDITNLVKRWYSGVPNYGMLIKAHLEQYHQNYPMMSCFSKNNIVTGNNPKPELVIHYKNQNGLESYMDYQQQTLSDITLHSNLYNGNLVGTINVGNTISGRFPAHLSLIYNTNDVILNNNYGYGLGLGLNFHQILKEDMIDGFSVLEYKDADGTLHYFYKGSDLGNDYPEDPSNPKVKRDPNTYYDEDGLSLTIKRENNDFIMTDSDGNTSKFVKAGDRYYLVEITDTEENKIQIQYDNNHRIVKVIDGNEEEITLEYEDNVITVVSPNETVTLSYLNNQLVNINSKNGTTNIQYNSKKIISKVTDISGKSIGYEYYDMVPYRMKKISEYGIQNNLGNTLEFTYGFNTTTLKDRNGYSTYTFNNQGNTIGVTSLNQNEELSDAYGKTFQYGEKNPYTTSFGTMNKIMSENPTIKVVKNYLENSSFEQSNNPFSGGTIVETESVTGKHSLHITGLVTKSIVVPKGKTYTFSAYIKTSENCEIRLSYLNSSNEEIHVSKIIEPNTLFERHSVTIDYPSNGSNFKIEMIGNNAYCDQVQLEEGEVANLYNYVDNSDFSKGIGDFKVSTNSLREGYTISNPASVVTLSNGNTALKVHGDPYIGESIEKKFQISGKKGDVYTIYFWYKNTGVEGGGPTSHRKVLIQFHYIDPDPSCVFPRGDYTINNTEWHFFEETFMAEYDYTGFTLILFNDMSANDLYLTNFALYQPIASDASYFYDDNGNMTHMSDPKSGPKELFYDKNNQLISMMDVKGSNFVYEYDNVIKDRVLKGISGTGISNEIEYDSFGNPIVTRITNKNKRSNIEGNYYIRKKGTKQYMTPDFVKNNLKLTESTCSHYAFTLIKQNELYKIVPAVNPNMSVYEIDHKLYLSKTKSTLFELQKNQNGSYTLIEPNSKLKITDQNGLLVLNNEGEFYLEEQDSRLFIENVAEYTEDGKFIKQTKDTLGRTTLYDIDPNTGLTNSVTDPKLISTDYTYNNKEQITKVKKKDHEVIYQYNSYDLLSKIIHGTKEYNFLYDEFLNTKQIKIGNQVLITNNYEANNGNLESSTYGNNQTISYVYDDFDRVSKVVKMNDTYLYYYDNLGNLSKVKTNDRQYEYYYDTNKRLIDYYDDLFHIGYVYNEKGNVKQKRIQSNIIDYEYNLDDAVTKVTFDGLNTLDYTYDELGRLKQKKLNDTYPTNYEYVSKGYRTSFLLEKLKLGENEYTYQYDVLDNITDIFYNGVKINHYEYDDHNELVKDDDYKRNVTTVYSYDLTGNLLKKEEYELGTEMLIHQDIYTYGNTNWEDQLTRFNNIDITYDAIGNPLTIGGKTLSWMNGRQLEKIEENDVVITYEYNKDSIRTKKVVNGIETTYQLENNHILFERTGRSMIYYIRDENQNLVGFDYDTTYYYLKNAQEDIIGILDSDYNVVANYHYDAWGRIISITDSNGVEITDKEHIAYVNPFRYRSYYYDSETGYYYLNSRYYDPNWGRFLNADGIIGSNKDFISHNLYAYVSNNSIKYDDELGQGLFGLIVVAGIVGFACGIAKQAISDITTSAMKKKKHVSSWQSYVGSGIGGIVEVATWKTGPVFSSSISSGASTLATDTLNAISGKQKFDPSKTVIKTAADMGTGAAFAKVEFKVNGITAGRNSHSAVFKSGLTKTQKYNYNMSRRTLMKGISANITDSIFSSEVSGIQTYVFDSIENANPSP